MKDKTLDDWIFAIFISWLLLIGVFMYAMTIYMEAWILAVIFSPLMIVFVLIGISIYKEYR